MLQGEVSAHLHRVGTASNVPREVCPHLHEFPIPIVYLWSYESLVLVSLFGKVVWFVRVYEIANIVDYFGICCAYNSDTGTCCKVFVYLEADLCE